MAGINGTSDAVAAYLMRQGKEVNQANIEACKKELYELANDVWGVEHTSLFAFDEETLITEEEFYDSLSQSATGGEIDLEQADLLFSILNFNGDETLSYDELSLIADKREDGIVTNFGIWQSIIGVVEPDAVISSSTNLKKNADRIKDVYGEDSDEYKAALSGQDITTDKQTLDSDKIQEITTKIINGEAKLEDYKDLLTDDSYKALKEAYEKAVNKANEEDGAAISTSSESTGTTQSDSTSTSALSTTASDYGSSLEEYEAMGKADSFYNASKGAGLTQSGTINELLDGLTGNDLAYVMALYEKNHGESLLDSLARYDLAHTLEEEDVFKNIAKKLVKEADNDAVAGLIAKELHNGAYTTSSLYDDFVDSIFGKKQKDDKKVKIISKKYYETYGTTLIKDLEGALTNGKYSEYEKRINK